MESFDRLRMNEKEKDLSPSWTLWMYFNKGLPSGELGDGTIVNYQAT
jgi:hypothetical protein